MSALPPLDGPDGLAAAILRSTLQDYAAGPKRGLHYLSACWQLEQIGWLYPDGSVDPRVDAFCERRRARLGRAASQRKQPHKEH